MGTEVQRFGVQYSEADTADLFQQAYTILVEALSSANQLKEVTEAEWRQALSAAPGLYFDWQGRCLWRCWTAGSQWKIPC